MSHRFGRSQAEAEEFVDVDEFFTEFAKRNPGWEETLASGRKALAQSAIAQERISAVARARLAKGLSQAQLAALIGTSQSHVARIEAISSDPQLSTLRKLATALDLSVADLVASIVNETA